MTDIKENKLNPYTIVTGQDVEKFEEGVNHLLELGYVPYGNVQTSSVLGKGDIITVYTQVMIQGLDEEDDEKCECHCHHTEETPKVNDEEIKNILKDVNTEGLEKQLLVEPANATKKTKNKKK